MFFLIFRWEYVFWNFDFLIFNSYLSHFVTDIFTWKLGFALKSPYFCKKSKNQNSKTHIPSVYPQKMYVQNFRYLGQNIYWDRVWINLPPIFTKICRNQQKSVFDEKFFFLKSCILAKFIVLKNWSDWISIPENRFLGGVLP